MLARSLLLAHFAARHSGRRAAVARAETLRAFALVSPLSNEQTLAVGSQVVLSTHYAEQRDYSEWDATNLPKSPSMLSSGLDGPPRLGIIGVRTVVTPWVVLKGPTARIAATSRDWGGAGLRSRPKREISYRSGVSFELLKYLNDFFRAYLECARRVCARPGLLRENIALRMVR